MALAMKLVEEQPDVMVVMPGRGKLAIGDTTVLEELASQGYASPGLVQSTVPIAHRKHIKLLQFCFAI